MNLILEHAPSHALIDLETAKLRLGVEGSEQDQDLAAMIREASSEIARFCETVFARQRYRDLLSGHGDTDLLLSHGPLEALSPVSVERDGSAITGFSVQSDDPPRLYRKQGWEWSAQWGGVLDPMQMPGTEAEDIQVEYHAGFLLPGTGIYTEQGEPVRQLQAAAAEAGATTLDLSSLSVTGKIQQGWGFVVQGSDLTYTVAADADAADNAFSISFTPALDIEVEKGALVTLSPHYLPPELSRETLNLVQAAEFRRKVPVGISKLAAESFSAEFQSPRDVQDSMASRIGHWRRRW